MCIRDSAEVQGKSVAEIKNIIASLHEFNPMMGHRGCRLAVTFPEIAAMQTLSLIHISQGFTITTEACTQYYEDGRQINDEIFAKIMESVSDTHLDVYKRQGS